MEYIDGGVTASKGFSASGVRVGLRSGQQKKDLALIYSENECNGAAVYTQNIVQAAPVTITKQHLSNGRLQAVICNSGNANACNADGEEKALATCQAVAKLLGIAAENVGVASTGTIGVPLNYSLIEGGLPGLVEGLSPQGNQAAMEAIMTTDTMEKQAAVRLELGGKVVTIGGISKGSGMIHPNMATMLAFITSDAAISSEMLRLAIKQAADKSFNRISVDGDTSTNDMALIMANGTAGNDMIERVDNDYIAFVSALTAVCTKLAKRMARDGEGATRMIECRVKNAPDEQAANALAKSVIASNLVKSALFGKDANWGRILCALGYAGVNFDPWKVDVCFESSNGRVDVCRDGCSLAFDEEAALQVLEPEEVTISVDLKQGDVEGVAWGCDLTYDYVRINGAYRT